MVAIGWGRWTLRTFIALSLALVVLASGGNEAKGAMQEATVADLVIWTFPLPDRVGVGSGNCIEIGPGTLNVSVSLAAGAGVGPIEFFLYGYGGRDPGSKIETVVNRNESAYALHLTGGIYCYSVWNRVSIDATAPPALLTSFGQSVSLRMTLSP